jgi:hypothetical protein
MATDLDPTATPRGSAPSAGKPRVRTLLTWAGIAAALAVLVVQVAQIDSDSPLFDAPDFAMYWASARLHLAGENPYDPAKLLPLERQNLPGQENIYIAYSPPWLLTVLLPFALPGYHTGRVLWLLLNALLVLVCSDGLWRMYGGPDRRRWLAWLIAFSFLPTLFLLKTGQIGALLLLGVVGFLYLERRGRDLAAGAALALLLLKPHLPYLFGLALLLWVIRGRRWRVLLGATLVGAFAALVPLAVNPAVFQQYQHTLAAYRPTNWVTPTPGALLRLAFGEQHEWLQFVPMIPGTAWLLAHWWRRRHDWDWARQTPLLVLVSLLTTCYGAWSHDCVLLLLPVLAAACQIAQDFRPVRAGVAVSAFLAVNGALLGLDLAGFRDELFVLWVPPVVLLAYLGLVRWSRRPVQGGEAT